MHSSRPYLLRAFYEWIADNNFTPYLVVDADYPGTEVPKEYVENGRIVLNVSMDAVRSLQLANDHVSFNARFSGVPHDIHVPMRAISAIYAKENGRGMVFKDDEDEDQPPPTDSTTGGQQGGKGKGGNNGNNGKPKLTIVK